MAPAALVIGGGTGIGAAVARRLAAGGLDVCVSGRRFEPLSEVASAVGRAGRRGRLRFRVRRSARGRRLSGRVRTARCARVQRRRERGRHGGGADARALEPRRGHEPDRRLPGVPGRAAGARGGARRDRDRVVLGRPARRPRLGRLLLVEGGTDHAHAVARARLWAVRGASELRLPGVGADGHGGCRDGLAGAVAGRRPRRGVPARGGRCASAPRRHARGGGRGGRVAGLAGRLVRSMVRCSPWTVAPRWWTPVRSPSGRPSPRP